MKTYKIDIFHPFSIDHISPVMFFGCVLENKTSRFLIFMKFVTLINIDFI